MVGIVLRGGSVVDGTGGPRRDADVLVVDGRIRDVLPPGAPAPGRTVDVSGSVVAPGFIDMHAHSDLAVIEDPEHLAKVLQGVTLEVCGQDGLSYAPASDRTLERMVSQLAGWNGEPRRDPQWRSVADYLDRIDDGAAVNVAYLVPHGTVRLDVVGDADRPSTDRELAQMVDVVDQGLRDGAVGLSTGLTYTPGMYATDQELIALCEAVRDRGGYHGTHHRNYGSHVVEAYVDAIELARRASVALHLTHCHVNFPQNRGRAQEVLQAVDHARSDGMDVTLDSYPYLAGATYLHALLPSWVQGGGSEEIVARITDPDIRERVLHELEVLGSDGHHGIPVEWDTIVVAGVAEPRLRPTTGRSIAELARESATAPGEFYLDLLVADSLRSSCRVDVGNEENVRSVMTHAAHTVGTDGILVGDLPHPRGWGTFPRYLGQYVRELGVLTLEEAVAHMTGRAARRLGLVDRGTVFPGAAADLVVFDPTTVASRATYERPRTPPDGIVHVIVNGRFTVLDGRRTSEVPGRSVRLRADGSG